MTSTSSTSKSKRRRIDPGRRPTRPLETDDTSSEEKLYEIRDILDEKQQGKTLLYLIDWADDRVTGETYENTWEPAHNVTRAAIDDWERKKRQAEHPSQSSSTESSSESESQPVQPPNWRKRRHQSVVSGSDRGRLSKRPRASRDRDSLSPGEELSEEWSHVDSVPANKLSVEIRNARNFNPSEYIAIALSQSSQPQTSQSQNNSQPICSGLRTPESEPEGRPGKGKTSQTTIPDSQEISDSLPSGPSQIVEIEAIPDLEPPIVDDSDSDSDSDFDEEGDDDSRVIQLDPVSSEVSDLNIPSRQPDITLPSIITQQLESAGPFEPQDENPSPKAPQPRTSSTGFLTQPDFNFPAFIHTKPFSGAGEVDPESHEDHASASNQEDTFAIPNQLLSHVPSINVPSASQAAQVVLPLSSYPQQIRTQTQEIVDSIESDVVPDTVLKAAPTAPAAQGATEQDHEEEAKFGEFVHHHDDFFAAAMSFGDDDGPSFADQLRQMRDSILSEPAFSSSRPASLGPAAAQPQEQSLVSPSSVLPGMETEAQGVPQGQGDSSTVWHDAPAPSISLPIMDMVFGSKPDQTASDQHASLPATSQDLGHDLGLGFPPENQNTTQIPASVFSIAHEQQSAFEQIPATVAPSDLTHATPSLLTLTGESHMLDESSGDHTLDDSSRDHVDTLLPGPESDHYHPDDDNEDGATGNFTVTLPMAANTRSEYLSRISGENQEIIRTFGKGFAESETWVPSDELVGKIDHIFQQLLDLCDLPAYVHDVSKLSTDAMWKHATGTNCKFSFVFEFLNAIKDLNTRVLIICREGYAFQYLEALLAGPGFNYSTLGQQSASEDGVFDGFHVTLASADEDLSLVRGFPDIIISFDHAARSVDLSPVTTPDTAPLVLLLVVTHSIEHLDLQLGRDIEGLDRKNSLGLALGQARDLFRTGDRGAEPHEIAEIFASWVRNPVHDFHWEPAVVPERVLDLWMSSQANSQEQLLSGQGSIDALNHRKRRFDEEEVGTPKRARIVESSSHLTPSEIPVQMSDLLKETLVRHPPALTQGGQVAKLVSAMESMAARLAELEAQLLTRSTREAQHFERDNRVEAELQDCKQSLRSIQPKYVEAVRDRGIFEHQMKAAEKKLEATEKKLEVRDAELAKAAELIQTLQTKLDTPESTRAAAAEKEAEEARVKLQAFEKKAANWERDMDYLRGQYQTVSSEAGKWQNERRDFIKKIEDLEQKARKNFVQVHEINNRINAEEQIRQLDEKNAIIASLEREVERMREELRHMKNGRRETRQASVPRSPMPGSGGMMMSPRPPRVRGSGGGGGPGSRGTSPAPVNTGAFYNNSNKNNNDGTAYSSSASASVTQVPVGFINMGGNNGPGGMTTGGPGPVIGGLSHPSMTLFNQPGAGNGGNRFGHLRD